LALNGQSSCAIVCPLLEQQRTKVNCDAELLGRD
jgi:hypothetical protein